MYTYIHTPTERQIHITHTFMERERGLSILYREIHCRALVHENMEDGKSKFCRAGQRPRKKLTLQPRPDTIWRHHLLFPIPLSVFA